jgi:hypothetical protein
MRTVLWNGSTNPGDDQDVTIPIGFDFEYHGQTYTELTVSTNGYAILGSGSAISLANQVPDAATPNTVLAPWWDDLNVQAFGGVDEISYDFFGMLQGQAVLTVEWMSVSRFGDNSGNHNFLYFQLALIEDGDQIEFHYGNSGSTGTPTTLSASCGIEDQTGTRGLAPLAGGPNLTLQDFPPSGTLFRFEPSVIALCGDCNGDGNTTVLDALFAAQQGAGLAVVSTAALAACNVAGTPGGQGVAGASVDVLDALLIARFDAGLLASLSCTP